MHRKGLSLHQGKRKVWTAFEAKWGRAPAEALDDRDGLLFSVRMSAGVRPEDALCDFAKMVFTDPS